MYSAAFAANLFPPFRSQCSPLPLCVILVAENGLCKYALKDCRQRGRSINHRLNHKRALSRYMEIREENEFLFCLLTRRGEFQWTA